MTGGGFFEPPNSSKTPPPGRVNFGFNAGPRSAENPEIKGELNLVDDANGDHIQGTTVDTYYAYGTVGDGDPEHCRVFWGDAKFNGTPGYRYTTLVCDYGEPGRDDRFAISVFAPGSGDEIYRADNYDGTPPPAGGELDGGNIQLHKSKCPKSAAAPSTTQTCELLHVHRSTHGM